MKGRDRALAPAVTTALYRVAQESLANIFRHARATEASVTLRMDEHSVTLEVCDNGAGFDPAERQGRGLANMRQRMEELAGDLRIESVPGEGTRVTAILTVEG